MECGSRRGRVNEEGKKGWLRYFLYMYEYRILKSAEVISRRGMREEGE
jgi:hypothetical protein